MIGFRFGNEQARSSCVPFPGEVTRHSLRDNPGRMRGQVLSAPGPVEVSVKHSAWATMALAVSAALAIAGCGSSSSPASTSSSSAPASSTSAATTAKFLGCMVTDTGGIDDKSFNQSSWEGMQAAVAADPGKIQVTYLPSTT